MMKKSLLLILALSALIAYAEPLEINVSHGGDVKTIAAALTVLRDTLHPDGAAIQVAPGDYVIESTIEIGSDSSGAPEAPVVIESTEVGGARIVAGRFVKGFKTVEDTATIDRLDPAARGNILVANLKSQGITDYGLASGGGLELFFNGDPMQIARWPNEGFTKIVEEAGGEKFKVHGQPGDKIGKWVYEGDRPSRWVDEKDPWLNGYWFWDWSSQYQRIQTIDVENRIIEVEEPYHGYGYRKGQWYYALNMLSELDMPGEWYLDRADGLLYFWPPSDIEGAEVFVSQLQHAIIINDAKHVELRGFVIEGARNTVIRSEGGAHNTIAACTMRNGGGGAISINGGENHTVIGCDIYNMGAGGIRLSGGDRPSLTPANHLAENNHIHHYARWHRMYQPGIGINGVGIKVRHNLIENAPHIAILFGGNDHLMEYNEIHSVCYESNDAGAIYAGRDWSQCGTVIRHNYMHHVTGFEDGGCVGVYLDDMFGGTEIHGNLFYKVYRAAFIGGGRNTTYANNLFVDCPRALHIDNRGQNWAAYHLEEIMPDRLNAMPYKGDLWAKRYPYLVNILEDDPAAPKYNVIARNIFASENWRDVFDGAEEYITFEDNLTDATPPYATPEAWTKSPLPRPTDFKLNTEAEPMPQGWQPLQYKKMGLYESEDRATWPVEHRVRK